MKTFVVGNSHVVALSQGIKALDLSSDTIQAFPLGSGHLERIVFHTRKDNKIYFIPDEYKLHLSRFTNSSFLTPEYKWGFCMGTHSARIYIQDFWQTAEPAEICQPDKRPIPIDVLDACIISDMRHICGFLAAAKSLGIEMFVVTCPPPRGDCVAIERGTRREVLSYIDQRMRFYFTAFLGLQKIDYIDYPDEIADETGLLKEKYFAPPLDSGENDPHHANEDYGILVTQNILKYLEQ